jgi:hypothetical protein
MSNYTQSTNFATKDALTSGDPLKIVKGTEINTEFVNIAVAVATKADLASPTFTGTPTLPTGTIAVTQSSSDDTTKLATTAFVQDVADAVKTALFPVGSIYTAIVSTNPGTLLGFGTWTAFGAGRTMVGFDSGNALFDTAEETGGSADAITVSHTHTFSGTTSTIGTHQHEETVGTINLFGTGATYTKGNYDGTGSGAVDLTNAGGSHDHTYSGTTASAGTSGTNANYQPYITVYLWKRTA